MRRVLVTGATGFIGSRTLPLLVERGFEVGAVFYGHQPIDVRGVRWYRTDLFDVTATASTIRRFAPTDLLHFAWYAVPSLYWDARENVRWLEASLSLLEEFAANGRRAVCAGTCAEYDWSHEICSEDETPLRPATLYGACKRALGEIADVLSERIGLSLAWGRIFFVYGPGEHADRLVPSVTQALLRGLPAPCSTGSQVRDFLHVDDLARAFVELLESDVTGPVNMASGRPLAIRDLLLAIGKAVGNSELLQFGALPARPNDPALLVADVRRLTEEIGWQMHIDVPEGVRDTVEWWRAQLLSTARAAPAAD